MTHDELMDEMEPLEDFDWVRANAQNPDLPPFFPAGFVARQQDGTGLALV